MTRDYYSTDEVATFAHLTSHMVHYLCRYEILRPSLSSYGRRGKRRRYSFRDVVVARAISKLLDAGASVTALQHAFKTLRGMLHERALDAIIGQRVVIKGQSVYLPESDEILLNLTANGQLAFHFVLDHDGRMAVRDSRQAARPARQLRRVQ